MNAAAPGLFHGDGTALSLARQATMAPNPFTATGALQVRSTLLISFVYLAQASAGWFRIMTGSGKMCSCS